MVLSDTRGCESLGYLNFIIIVLLLIFGYVHSILPTRESSTRYVIGQVGYSAPGVFDELYCVLDSLVGNIE